MHSQVCEARRQQSVLCLRETREAFVCAWLSTVLAKSEQQHGATGGIQTVPALNFTCQHMGTSLGKQTEGGTVPKSTEHLSAAWRARPILWRVPRGTARSSGDTNTSRSMHKVGSHAELRMPKPCAKRCTLHSRSFVLGGECRKYALPTAAHGAHAARAANGFASPSAGLRPAPLRDTQRQPR